MGAIAFAVIMLGMLFFGIGCIVVGIILRSVQKRKVLKGISIGVLVLGIISCLIPVGWVIFLRIGNSTPDEDYVDTGIMAEWDESKEEQDIFADFVYELPEELGKKIETVIEK